MSNYPTILGIVTRANEITMPLYFFMSENLSKYRGLAIIYTQYCEEAERVELEEAERLHAAGGPEGIRQNATELLNMVNQREAAAAASSGMWYSCNLSS
jgi:hypothetical protein